MNLLLINNYTIYIFKFKTLFLKFNLFMVIFLRIFTQNLLKKVYELIVPMKTI